MGFDRSTLHFTLLYVGVCVALASTGAFLGIHDQDYKYQFDRSSEEYPDNAGETVYYSTLSPERQTDVDRALAGETIQYETKRDVPPEVVRKNGTYHVFNAFAHFDWGHRGTYGPVLVGFAATALVVWVVRRDHRHG